MIIPLMLVLCVNLTLELRSSMLYKTYALALPNDILDAKCLVCIEREREREREYKTLLYSLQSLEYIS